MNVLFITNRNCLFFFLQMIRFIIHKCLWILQMKNGKFLHAHINKLLRFIFEMNASKIVYLGKKKRKLMGRWNMRNKLKRNISHYIKWLTTEDFDTVLPYAEYVCVCVCVMKGDANCDLLDHLSHHVSSNKHINTLNDEKLEWREKMATIWNSIRVHWHHIVLHWNELLI